MGCASSSSQEAEEAHEFGKESRAVRPTVFVGPHQTSPSPAKYLIAPAAPTASNASTCRRTCHNPRSAVCHIH